MANSNLQVHLTGTNEYREMEKECNILRNLLKLRTEEKDEAIQKHLNAVRAYDHLVVQINNMRALLGVWSKQCPCSCPACVALITQATGGN